MKFKFFKRKPVHEFLVPQNPEVLAGDCAPVGPSDSPLEPAWHKAATTLGTNHIRLVWSMHEGQCWFVAAREADFQGTGAFTSRLAAALPGHPLHKGEGAYLDSGDQRHALAMFREGKLAIRTGSREQLEREAERAKLPLIEIDPQAATEWTLFEQFTHEQSWNRIAALAWTGAAVFAIGAGLTVFSVFQHQAHLQAAQVAHQSQDTWKKNITAQLDTALAMPLTSQRERLRDAEYVALATGGHLTHWKLSGGHVEFKAVLPSFVRPADYAALGPQVRVVPVAEGVEVFVAAKDAKP